MYYFDISVYNFIISISMENYVFLFKLCKRCLSLLWFLFGVDSTFKFVHALRIIIGRCYEKLLIKIVGFVGANVMTTLALTDANGN